MSGSGVASDYGDRVQKPLTWPYEPGNAGSRYFALEGTRMLYQFRAIRFASLTLPNLFRIIGANGSTDEITAWQSYGALCCKNLASKLMLSIFPPGVPFIRIKPSRQVLQHFAQMDPEESGDLKVSIEKGLEAAEREFSDGVAEDGDAATLYKLLLNLIVGGNYALHHQHDGTIRGIPFVHWVVQRDKAGNLIEFCIKDTMIRETLPGDVKKMLNMNTSSEGRNKSPGAAQTEINLFTYGRRMDGTWHVSQECNNLIVPETQWRYTDDALPFQFIPFNLLDGEHYGRSYVEDFEADLQTLDGMEQSVTEGIAAAARYVTMVKPGSVTNKRALAEALNGDVITGDVADVGTLESGKATDFESGINRIDAKEKRLGAAFLMQGDVRDAERVTAEEIRQYTTQLQDQLGGIYTGLVPNVQSPYAKRKMASLQRTGRMVYLPKGTTKVVLVTGAAALGRNQELSSLDALVSPQSQAAQQAAGSVIDWSVFYQRRAIGLSVDQDGLVKTKQQLQQEQQQAMQQEMMAKAAPSAVSGVAGLAKQQMQNTSDQQMQASDQAHEVSQSQNAPPPSPAPQAGA